MKTIFSNVPSLLDDAWAPQDGNNGGTAAAMQLTPGQGPRVCQGSPQRLHVLPIENVNYVKLPEGNYILENFNHLPGDMYVCIYIYIYICVYTHI